jgi:sialic acid synthase SpsE|tara:strand:- start:40 stop:258 length:219 start_codon:yes stop_codon:yes gene_type:complete
MIIAEVGINHLGNINLLKKYIPKINKTDVDAITLQILNKKFFYDNNLKKYYILKEKILNLVFKYSKKSWFNN